jgi:hypothetical protein
VTSAGCSIPASLRDCYSVCSHANVPEYAAIEGLLDAEHF